MRAKLFGVAALGLLCLILPDSLRADTVYTYTGNLPRHVCSRLWVNCAICYV